MLSILVTFNCLLPRQIFEKRDKFEKANIRRRFAKYLGKEITYKILRVKIWYQYACQKRNKTIIELCFLRHKLLHKGTFFSFAKDN